MLGLQEIKELSMAGEFEELKKSLDPKKYSKTLDYVTKKLIAEFRQKQEGEQVEFVNPFFSFVLLHADSVDDIQEKLEEFSEEFNKTKPKDVQLEELAPSFSTPAKKGFVCKPSQKILPSEAKAKVAKKEQAVKNPVAPKSSSDKPSKKEPKKAAASKRAVDNSDKAVKDRSRKKPKLGSDDESAETKEVDLPLRPRSSRAAAMTAAERISKHVGLLEQPVTVGGWSLEQVKQSEEGCELDEEEDAEEEKVDEKEVKVSKEEKEIEEKEEEGEDDAKDPEEEDDDA